VADGAGGGLFQVDERAAERTLATAGFADERQRLAGVDVDIDAVDGAHPPASAEQAREEVLLGRIVLDQSLGTEQRVGHGSPTSSPTST